MRSPVRLLPLLLGALWLTCTPSREPGPLLIWLTVSPAQEKILQEVVQEFSRRQGIPVRLEAKSPAEIESWLADGPKSKFRPDLVDLEVERLSRWVAAFQDLEPLMKKWDPPPFLYSAWAPGTFSDRLYFLPWRLSWTVMVCNGSALPAPPRTWEELLTVAAEHPGGVALAGLWPEDLARFLVPWIWQAGGDPYDFTNAGTIRAFEYLGRLGPYLNLSTRSFTEESVLAAQVRGEVILHFNRLPAVQEMARQNLLPFTHYTAAWPAGPKGAAGLLEGNYLGIPQAAPHPKEAYRFLQFLFEPRVQSRFFAELGWLSPLTANTVLRPLDRECYQGFEQMTGALRVLPDTPQLPAIQKLWAQAFAEVVYEGIPAAEVLPLLAPEMRRLRR